MNPTHLLPWDISKNWTTLFAEFIFISGFALAAQGNNHVQSVVCRVFLDVGLKITALFQFVDPLSFAVLGPQGAFHNDSFTEFFNPTNTEPPFFQIFHQDFLAILGPSPSFHQVASNPAFAFAHEGPIYFPETDEVFFASNAGGALGQSDLEHNNQVAKISMADVETALNAAVAAEGSNATVNISVTKVISFLSFFFLLPCFLMFMFHVSSIFQTVSK